MRREGIAISVSLIMVTRQWYLPVMNRHVKVVIIVLSIQTTKMPIRGKWRHVRPVVGVIQMMRKDVISATRTGKVERKKRRTRPCSRECIPGTLKRRFSGRYV
jgi:hypothetical protein